MTNHATKAEYLFTQKVAREYRSKGYEVTLVPKIDFLPGMTPDILVRRGKERIVVGVKSGTSLAADRSVAEMARILYEKPGWTFELVLVPEPEKLDSPDGARSWERERILLKSEEAEGLLRSGFSEAAFLTAWSTCEAAIRAAVAEEGVPESGVTTGLFVISQAVFEGVLSRSEYDDLMPMLEYRNAIVHGFDAGEPDAAMTSYLLALARRMAASDPGDDADAGT